MAEFEFGEGSGKNLDNFKRRAFGLCLAVYRVTKLFPAGEVLTKQLREVSSEIVASLATEKICDTILKVEELKIYLGVAREQNWLKPINFDLLKTAYCLLSDGLNQYQAEEPSKSEKGESREKIITTPLPEPRSAWPEPILALPTIKKEQRGESDILGRREQLILNHLNNNKEVKVSELLKILGGVSERTIRNDLADLIGRNLVKKVGSRKDAKYILV